MKRVMKAKGRNHFPEAVAMLVGTIIGAGVLGIPYVIAKSGFLLGLLNILVLGGIMMLINLYTGEIALRTKKNHMLPGYAGKYLGKWGKIAMTMTLVFGIYGALIAYTIGEGEVLSSIFGGSAFFWGIGFFILFAGLMYFRLSVIAESELFLSATFLILILAIILFAAPNINLENLKDVNLSSIFVPYGAVLFAFAGYIAIPEMKEELRKRPKLLKKAIIVGSIIPIILYIAFAAVVVGVSGVSTTEVGTLGLGEVLGKNMLILGNLFAMFTMATSFLLLGYALKWMFYYDYGFSRFKSWILSWVFPLSFFLIFDGSFVKIIGITGAPLNWAVAGVLILFLVLGMLYQVLA